MKLKWKTITTEHDIVLEARPNHPRHPILTISRCIDEKEDSRMALVDIRCDGPGDIDEILFCYLVPPWAPADQKICSKCNGTGEFFCNGTLGFRDCLWCKEDGIPILDEAIRLAEILYQHWSGNN